VVEILEERGVTTPITAIPTGVDPAKFAHGDGSAVRERLDISEDVFLIGHVGRLAPEKNLLFLADGVTQFLQEEPNAHFLIVGDGDSADEMRAMFTEAGVDDRTHLVGVKQGQELVNHYHAMHVFVFASTTETQGMVLAEAMAAGVPVLALDAPGAREIVRDGLNGFLLKSEKASDIGAALSKIYALSHMTYAAWRRNALKTAQGFSRERTVEQVLQLYEHLLDSTPRGHDHSSLEAVRRALEKEWEIWSNRISAGVDALVS
jgi:glycosyltransferase involved in cell wall biosynthesis